METYDSNGNGKIDVFEVGNMIADTYRALNLHFEPTGSDRSSYMRTITRKGINKNQDEIKLTKEDIEQTVNKFFYST